MGYSQYDLASQCRPAWNAGKSVGTKRPLTQKQIWEIRSYLDREGRLRDRALFDLAIDSKLRGCDLVKIKIGDLVSGADIRTRAIVVQQKRVDRFSSDSVLTFGQACSHGWSGGVDRWMITLSPAGSIMPGQ